MLLSFCPFSLISLILKFSVIFNFFFVKVFIKLCGLLEVVRKLVNTSYNNLERKYKTLIISLEVLILSHY